MKKATRFYYNSFRYPKTQCILTIFDEDWNKLTIYSDQEKGYERHNPIYLDDSGVLNNIYVEKGKLINIELIDLNTREIIYKGSLNRLEGKDGGEPDLDWQPTEEELEDNRGRDGEQGLSIIGPIGDKGPTGQRGAPAYNKIVANDMQEIIIPKGVKEIFITASAGGGSAGKFSNSVFMYDMKHKASFDDSRFRTHLSYRYSEDESLNTLTSKNYENPIRKNFVALYFIPSAGFAGEGVYYHKIRIANIEEDHIVKIKIGKGGKFNEDIKNLNGGNGEDTIVYLDDKEVLKLKGGKGGENFSPYMDQDEFFIPYDFKQRLHENVGYKRNTVYLRYFPQPNLNNEDSLQGYESNQFSKTVFYKGFYHEKYGEFWKNRDFYFQCELKAERYLLNRDSHNHYNFYLGYTGNMDGQKGTFGKIYGVYNYLNYYSPDTYRVKTGTQTVDLLNERGFGSGGDVPFVFADDTNKTNVSQRIRNNLYLIKFRGLDFYIYDYKTMLDIQKKVINNFEPATTDTLAYKPGVVSYVDYDDLFANYELFEKEMSDKIVKVDDGYKYAMTYNGVGFYRDKSMRFLGVSYGNNMRTNEGLDGFGIVEFGNIEVI